MYLSKSIKKLASSSYEHLNKPMLWGAVFSPYSFALRCVTFSQASHIILVVLVYTRIAYYY